MSNSEKFNVHAIRVKKDRPQILTSITYQRDYLMLMWEDYLCYQLSIRLVKVNDDYVTLKSLLEEEFPQPEYQKIWRE